MTRPRILYFTRIDFPSPRANSIQSVQTCWELARHGAEVFLVVRRLEASRQECLRHYDLPDHPRLRFVSLSQPGATAFNDWRGPAFRSWLTAFVERYRTPWTCAISRDPAGLELFKQLQALPQRQHLTTLFEVHKISYRVKESHQLERGRSLDDPKVRAKVEARRRLEAAVYGNVDGIVCTSHAAARELREAFDVRAPITVLPNGTQLPEEARRSPAVVLDDSRRDLDIVYVGQLYRWKGVDGLLRAMAHLPERHLTIVGGNDAGDLERLRALSESLGLGGRIDFHGHVAPHAVRDVMRRARVGVVPLPQAGSLEATLYTSPLKLFEWMAHGVPVVATDVPAIRELVTDGEHALLVAPDSDAALAAGIRRLLEDRTLAARLAQAAFERVRQYTWAARARRLLEFMDAVHAPVEMRGR